MLGFFCVCVCVKYSHDFFFCGKSKASEAGTCRIKPNSSQTVHMLSTSLSLLCKKSFALWSFCYLIDFFDTVRWFSFWIPLNEGNAIYFNYSWANLSEKFTGLFKTLTRALNEIDKTRYLWLNCLHQNYKFRW